MQKNNYYLAKKIDEALQNKKDDTANIWIIERELNKESVPAETLVSQPSEPTFGQWIDAKVELPKPIDKGYAKSIRVIGCWGDSADNIAEVDFEETIIRGKEVKRFKWNNIICPWNIIKWMPLPKP